jgi:hypothetical protein
MQTTSKDKWLKMNEMWPVVKVHLTQAIGLNEYQVDRLYPFFQSFFSSLAEEYEEQLDISSDRITQLKEERDVLRETMGQLKRERSSVYDKLVEARAELMLRDNVWYIPDGVDKKLQERGWHFMWNGSDYLYAHKKLTGDENVYDWVTVDEAWRVEASAQER